MTIGKCGKVRHASKAAARVAVVHLHARIRVYFCRSCVAWHTTNDEKNARVARTPKRPRIDDEVIS